MTADPQNVPGKVLVGKAQDYLYLLLRYGNRHGLVAGATGTGKTVTLQKLAEGFCSAGTCVFAADVKGDLSGIAMPGDGKKAFVDRAMQIGLSYEPDQFRCVFWDIFGENGHPVRATIAEMGPLLLSRILQLNEIQEGVLNIAFRVADEQGLALLDLKDLRAILGYISQNAADLQSRYGNVAPASIGAIQRQLLVLENQGADKFFGEPALDINDLLKPDIDGRGFINILKAEKLIRSPDLYATFLFWLLSELFDALPEVGDPDKPKLVFFFDEAHLLFDNAPKALLAAIEQVVRLIRCKGVGVYFVTQSPARRAGHRARPAWQSRPARPARLHPARPKGGQGRGRHFSPKPRFRHGGRDHQARCRRGARLDAGGKRRASHGDARLDRAAGVARRPHHFRRIAGSSGIRALSRASTTPQSIANPLSKSFRRGRSSGRAARRSARTTTAACCRRSARASTTCFVRRASACRSARPWCARRRPRRRARSAAP